MSAASRVLVAPIHAYQHWISPALPRRCRYYPSCSAYAIGALHTHGAIKGTLLALWRLLRCNPFTRGGVDHVPELGQWRYHLPKDQPRPLATAAPTALPATAAAEPGGPGKRRRR